MIDVVEVVLYPLREVGVAAQIVDLRPAGNAGLDQMLLHVAGNPLAELPHELRSLGARSDKRHLALQHIEKLRQFVEAVAAQESAESGRTPLPAARPNRAGARFGVQRHRPELEHRETLAIPRDALL